MKLGQKATAVLEAWGAFTDDRRRLVVDGDQCSIVGEVTAADKLSCSLAELRVEPKTPLALTPNQLGAWGQSVGKRVRYLLEAIETVELDATAGRMMLRSTPPERKDDGSVLYYELVLEATGSLVLSRRRFSPPDRSCTSVALHFTRELLEKLTDDLAATRP
jgi:hypothetical protein